MTIIHSRQVAPDVPPDQRRSAEAAKLVCKLRWIGKEREARVLERQLRRIAWDERPIDLAEPFTSVWADRPQHEKATLQKQRQAHQWARPSSE